MSKIVVGVVAFVDAGKTSTIEAILNVNHALDFNNSEKKHGITINTKLARYNYQGQEYIFLDTPGHRDFNLELERSLRVMDIVLLVVDGSDSSYNYLKATIDMIKYYQKPMIIGINKIDIASYSRVEIIHRLNEIGLNIIEYNDEFIENVALVSDELLLEYEANHDISKDSLINSLDLYQPATFYSATKAFNIDSLLKMIDSFATYKANLEAYKVFKIAYDNKGQRLTYLRVFNTIKLKGDLNGEKIDEIRSYHLNEYQSLNSAGDGDIVALVGIKRVGIKDEKSLLKPYMQYEIITEKSAKEVFDKISPINEEEPLFKLRLEDNHLYINLMGEVSKTVMDEMLYDRYGIKASFVEKDIQLFERIKKESYGYAHIEGKGVYAEIHVRLSRNDNEGLFIDLNMISDMYDSFSLDDYKFKGLYDLPLLDTKIEVVDMKTNFNTHIKDLKEALILAVNDGLNRADTEALEPYASIKLYEDYNDYLILISKYQYEYRLDDGLWAKVPYRILKTWLKNRNISFDLDKYEAVKENIGLNKTKLMARSYKFDEIYEGDMIMDILDIPLVINKPYVRHNIKISDEELKRVFNRSHAPKERLYTRHKEEKNESYVSKNTIKPKLMMVDAYNLIHSFPFSYKASEDLYNARYDIISILKEYQALKGIKMVVVFDAYNRGGGISQKSDDFKVVYTKENETADAYIERECKNYLKDYQVVVLSSDHAIQVSTFQSGATRMSTRAFISEYESLKRKYLKG